MASFRSNLNSVPKVAYGLTALKNRFSTCFQNLYQKHFKLHQHFYSDIAANVKFKKLFKPSKCSRSNFEKVKSKKIAKAENLQQNRKGEKIEIVAKLLSSTLIAATVSETTATTTTLTQTTTETISTVTQTPEGDDSKINMTITDDNFLHLRDEYPDLESEIRSILLARAQEGATIADIRADYKKLTGEVFPIYNNVTDFLLCIPSVSVLCNERGTRIFGIVPTEKTKHLYDLVLAQKPTQQQGMRPSYPSRSSNNYYNTVTARQRQYGRGEQQPLYDNKIYNNNNNKNNNNNNIERYNRNANDVNYNNNCIERPTKRPHMEKASSESAESLVEYCFYQDNYNYLNNRFTGQAIDHYPLISDLHNKYQEINNNILNTKNANIKNDDQKNFNNICSYANHIAQQQNVFKVPEPPRIEPTNLVPNVLQHHVGSSFTTGTKSSQHNESLFTQDPDYEAHLLDFPLLGDDFFLYLARMELKCKFKKFQKVLQSGLCVSGQSILTAISRIEQLPIGSMMDRRVIVNIGSVDIMKGKPLVQIEHSFRKLIKVMQKRGMKPILTTVAPLANYSHMTQVKKRLESFNEFIKKECHQNNLLVIDIWSCLVNEKHQIHFDCFQNEPRTVTGTNEPYVFWNKIGRQRVLQMIEAKIEY